MVISDDAYPDAERPVEAWCDPHDLHVRLADGRQVSTPLWWYPRLLNATPAQRNVIALMPGGIHWPEIDEDLSIDGMLKGRRAPGAVSPKKVACVTEQKPAYYFVTDIETDGPDPALNSMLSFATVVLRQDGMFCGEFEGVLEPRPDRVADKDTMQWWAKHPQAWSAATSHAQEPELVMKRYADWVESYDGIRSFAARPLMFDGLWIDHYLREFAGSFVLDVHYWGRCIFNASPLDIGTYTSGVFGRTNPYDAGVKMPEDWLGNHPHTHHAIDDARGYASFLSRLFAVARELPPNPHDFIAKSTG